MSWLFNSLQQQPHDDDPSSSRAQTDLSLLTQTLSRQLRGVATFLAPPPPSNDALPSSDSPPHSPPQSQPLLGIRNDLAEFGGSFKNSLSLLSSNKAVTGISNFASNLLQLPNNAADDDDDPDGDDAEYDADVSAPGITDEVVGFVTEISVLPDYWTGFPIPLDHEDFNVSDAQREHASAVERLVPGLADLRVGICSSMSEEQFWMIYFLLLLPRLTEDDFELLSTPKIVEARDVLLHKLQNKRNTEVVVNTAEKRKTQGEEISAREKEALTEMVNTAERLKIDDEESTEHWSEEASISSGSFVDGQKKLEPEEDISFSDLEDDENELSSGLSGQRRGQDVRACSPNGTNDWVRLNRSSEIEGGQQNAGQSKEKDLEGEDSSDWLAVDEFD